MSEHTPGPWIIIRRLSDVQSGMDLYVGRPDRREELQDFSLAHAEEHVARVFGGEANARLIAAAPALLDALVAVMEDGHYRECLAGQRGYGSCSAVCERVKAAIALARGEDEPNE